MEIETLFKANNGIIKARQLKKRSLYNQIKKLIALGVVEKIKTGVYKHLEIAPGNDWIEVAKIIDGGVFCLQSACFYYGLSTDIPNEYQVAVAHKRKINLPVYPNIKLFYWTEKSLNTGITLVKEDNHEFKIYNLEKTVCDMIRFRNKIDTDTLNQVIRNYYNRKDKNMDLLYKYSKILRIEKKVKDYVNLLY